MGSSGSACVAAAAARARTLPAGAWSAMRLSSPALPAFSNAGSPGPATAAGAAGGAGSRATSNWQAAPRPASRSAARRTSSPSRAEAMSSRLPAPSRLSRAST